MSIAGPGWWAVALMAGPYDAEPCLTVYREDEQGEQRRLVCVSLTTPAGPVDADRVLTAQGWRRTGEWVSIGEGDTAPIARANGRPPDGIPVKARLWLDDLEAVDGLVGIHGRDRSQVIAWLVRRGLETPT